MWFPSPASLPDTRLVCSILWVCTPTVAHTSIPMPLNTCPVSRAALTSLHMPHLQSTTRHTHQTQTHSLASGQTLPSLEMPPTCACCVPTPHHLPPAPADLPWLRDITSSWPHPIQFPHGSSAEGLKGSSGGLLLPGVVGFSGFAPCSAQLQGGAAQAMRHPHLLPLVSV